VLKKYLKRKGSKLQQIEQLLKEWRDLRNIKTFPLTIKQDLFSSGCVLIEDNTLGYQPGTIVPLLSFDYHLEFGFTYFRKLPLNLIQRIANKLTRQPTLNHYQRCAIRLSLNNSKLTSTLGVKVFKNTAALTTYLHRGIIK